MVSWFALLAVPLPFVFASSHLDARQQVQPATKCDQKFATIPAGQYSLLTNLWGTSDAAGWQCCTLEFVEGNVVQWYTNYSWYDSTSIMSFSNIQLDKGLNQPLSALSSIPSKWEWSQSGDDVVADVAYDLFTSRTKGGSNANEVMVWLANFGAGPICDQYDSGGKAVPLATNLDINMRKWNVFRGTNGYNPVYSFIPVEGHINSFTGNMYHFFSYLIDNGHIQSSEYLKTVQAGTEVTSGIGRFDTSAYSISIH